LGSLFNWRLSRVCPSNVFLNDGELEDRWRRKSGYVAELRAQGRGPAFVKLSPRVVRYRLSDVIAYEQRNTFASNAEAIAAGDDEAA
jgi:hypothetical protein